MSRVSAGSGGAGGRAGPCRLGAESCQRPVKSQDVENKLHPGKRSFPERTRWTERDTEGQGDGLAESPELGTSEPDLPSAAPAPGRSVGGRGGSSLLWAPQTACLISASPFTGSEKAF